LTFLDYVKLVLACFVMAVTIRSEVERRHRERTPGYTYFLTFNGVLDLLIFGLVITCYTWKM